MNRAMMALLLLLAVSFVPSLAQAEAILFDFGPSSNQAPDTPNYYNDVNSASVGEVVSNAKDAAGTDTGISLSITDSFFSTVQNGINSSAAGFEAMAQYDSLYVRGTTGDDNNDTGIIRLSGLDTNALYDIVLFGSRTSEAGTDRYTVYTIDGVEKVLNCKGNSSEVVTFSNWAPDSQGNIDIGARLLTNSDTTLLAQLGIASTNTDHGYLSAMSVTASVVPEPGSVTLLLAVACFVVIGYRRVQR